jgi:hypothetical protein
VVVAVVVRACVVRDAGEDGEEGARCIDASGGLKRARVVHGVAGLVSVKVCVCVCLLAQALQVALRNEALDVAMADVELAVFGQGNGPVQRQLFACLY